MPVDVLGMLNVPGVRVLAPVTKPAPPDVVGVLSCVIGVCAPAAAVELAVVAPAIKPDVLVLPMVPVLPGVVVLPVVAPATWPVPPVLPGVPLLVPDIWPAVVGGVNTEFVDVPVSTTPPFLVVGSPPHWFQRLAV